jgi:hypothetical protein
MRTEDDYIYLLLNEVMKAAGLVQHIAKHYWLVHPNKGLMFYPYKKTQNIKYAAPQCNLQENITRRLAPEFAEVRYIESVLIPIDPREYA